MAQLAISLRTLCRRPGFSLLAAAMLAIGIGTVSVIFSICDAELFRPLPVQAPNELVAISQHLPRVPVNHYLPYSCYRALHGNVTTLSAVFGETGRDSTFAVTAPQPIDSATVSGVTPEYFEALGVEALYGRVLTPGDAEPNSGMPPAMLSYSFWRKHFASSPTAVGHATMSLNGHPFRVVGVLPPSFHGIFVSVGADIQVPLQAWKTLAGVKEGDLQLELAARMAKGAGVHQAESQCQSILRPVLADYLTRSEHLSPEELKLLLRTPVNLDPLAHGISDLPPTYQSVLRMLSLCAGLVFLIVCTNVAGILLLRLAERRQEFAIRLATGASPFHLVQQILIENVLLGVLGTLGGVLLAAGTLPFAVRILPQVRNVTTSPVSAAAGIGLSGRVILIVALTAAASITLFSITPVLSVWRTTVSRLLESDRVSVGLGSRRFIIFLQIGVCTFVLVLAALFARTLRALEGVDPGFDAARVVTFTGDLSTYPNPTTFLRSLLARVAAIPGVEAAGISAKGVMRGSGLKMTVEPVGARITAADFLNTSLNGITSGYFDSLGMRMVSGRNFTPEDDFVASPPPPLKVVVNQSFAERFFPNRPVLGQRFGGGSTGMADGRYEISGVVTNAKYRSLREAATPTFYTPLQEVSSFVLNVRTRRDPAWVIGPVTAAWHAIGSMVPVLEVHGMEEEIAQSMAVESMTAAVASVFGAAAVFLAGVGLYGILAYYVRQRRREIAIRMALGGNRLNVGGLVVMQTCRLLAPGVCAGFAAVMAARSAYGALLYGVVPFDPRSFVFAAVFMFLVGTAATALPVYRAIGTDPAAELKGDAR